MSRPRALIQQFEDWTKCLPALRAAIDAGADWEEVPEPQEIFPHFICHLPDGSWQTCIRAYGWRVERGRPIFGQHVWDLEFEHCWTDMGDIADPTVEDAWASQPQRDAEALADYLTLVQRGGQDPAGWFLAPASRGERINLQLCLSGRAVVDAERDGAPILLDAQMREYLGLNGGNELSSGVLDALIRDRQLQPRGGGGHTVQLSFDRRVPPSEAEAGAYYRSQATAALPAALRAAGRAE